ncbi:hypothetical protein [uncultured Roseobacter sp.]|uniref:hypothetical protein n=1 Tax=uncultured Roseobacter sp. TaxID=114847 RepID=UPI00261DA67E|nr:hypothetical protein [uncultured Roseobacter sp.]
MKSVRVFEQRVGVDGGVRDLLLTFRALDEIEVADAVTRINILLYGTAYKAHFKPFTPGTWSADIGPVRRISTPTFSVGPQDVGAWLVEQAVAFMPLDGEPELANASAPATELLRQPGSVYRSVEPGLILLVIDRSVPLNDQVVQLRKFLIDADLILAAIVNNQDDPDRIGILGRERDESLEDAPPLRIDTFLTLAANRSEDLAQSYERNMPFAGRARTPVVTDNVEFLNSVLQKAIRGYYWGADWAPILLSQELTHTEYGHILNITDQMLKGWSMAGDIEYANFPYRHPAKYPDRDGVWVALEDAGNPITSLTFNWNTAGSAFWSENEGLFIMTMPTTGALPVSYIPDVAGDEEPSEADDIRAAEDRYHGFFAAHRDAMLIRVAQYSAIHQIFQRYQQAANRSEPLVDKKAYDARWAGLVDLTATALDNMAKFDVPLSQGAAQGCSLERLVEENIEGQFDDRRAAAADALSSFSESEYPDVAHAMVDVRHFLESRYSALMAQEQVFYEAAAAFDAEVDVYNRKVHRCRQRHLLMTGCDNIESEFDRLTAKDTELTRMYEAFEPQALERDTFLDRFDRLQSNRAVSDALKLNGSCEAAVHSIQNGMPDAGDSVYTTPSIVISVPWMDWEGVGGHNLNGRTVDIVVDKNLKPGEIKVDPNGNVIRVPESAKAHKAQIAREFERRRMSYMQGSPRFRQKFKTDLAAITTRVAAPPKPLNGATLKRSPHAPTERGARRQDGDAYFFVDAVKVEPEAAKVAELTSLAQSQNADIVLSRTGRQVTIFDASGNPPGFYRADSPSGALARVHQISAARASTADGPIRITTENISAAEARANTKVLSIKDRLETEALTALGGNGAGKPPGGGIVKFLFPDGPRRNNDGRGILGRILTLKEGNAARLGLAFKKRKIDWESAVIKTATVDGNRVVNTIELSVANQPSRMSLIYRALFHRKATAQDAANLDAATRAALDTAKQTNSEQIGDFILKNREEFFKLYEANEVDVQIIFQMAPDSFVVTDLKLSSPPVRTNG